MFSRSMRLLMIVALFPASASAQGMARGALARFHKARKVDLLSDVPPPPDVLHG